MLPMIEGHVPSIPSGTFDCGLCGDPYTDQQLHNALNRKHLAKIARRGGRYVVGRFNPFLGRNDA